MLQQLEINIQYRKIIRQICVKKQKMNREKKDVYKKNKQTSGK